MLGGGHLVALGRPSRPAPAALTTLSPPSKICRWFSGLNNIWPQEPSQGLVLAVSSPAAPDKPRVSGCCVCRQLWLLQSLWVEAWLQLAACPWRASSTEHRGPRCPTSGLTHTHKHTKLALPPNSDIGNYEDQVWLTWHLVNNLECWEVAEGGGGEDAVAVAQPVNVHHAQVQQLQQRSKGHTSHNHV